MDGKYTLVIQDFFTSDSIDILCNRRSGVTEPYFASIPTEERCKVNFLLSDMYNQYIAYVDKYFPNAVAVVDSFHVVMLIVYSIDMYIRQLEKQLLKRDREKEERISAEQRRPISHHFI